MVTRELVPSILGSLYIVGPLVLQIPMRVTKGGWMAFGSFVLGASGMVSHFWINTYGGMAWSGETYRVAAGHNYYWRKGEALVGTDTYERPDISFTPMLEW